MSVSIYSHTKDSFCECLAEKLGKGALHARKIYQAWMQQGRFVSPEEVEPQAKELLLALLEATDTSLPPFQPQSVARETYKYLLLLEDGLEVEFVAIPMKSGITLCISSQVGCLKGCRFCETGKMGLLRQLSVREIVAQVYHAKYSLNLEVRNIVFMGMGEPFDNYDNVMQAIRVLTDPHGLSFGPRHITVSTSGVVDKIYRFADEADHAIGLAVSVNAPTDAIRTKLMPVNRKWNMAALREAMVYYLRSPRREILAEYVLLAGINDRPEDIEHLARYLEGLRLKVNVIPYNAGSFARFAPPDQETIDRFVSELRGRGFTTLLRTTKGEKIMAACGQLGNLALYHSRFKN